MKKGLSETSLENYEKELIDEIAKREFIVNGLKNYEPYNRLIEDLKEIRSDLDESWHLVMDPAKLAEVRMTKFGINSIVNKLEFMEQEMRMYQDRLEEMRNPENIISKDYDAA